VHKPEYSKKTGLHAEFLNKGKITMSEKEIILIVDDTESNRTIFETYLEMQGFKVYFTKNDNQVLQKTRQILPDIILLNIVEPDADDCRILEHLKNDPNLYDIPTMALTVKSSPENLINDLWEKANDVLIKPFDVEEFSQKVKDLIKIKKNQNAVILNANKMMKQQGTFKIQSKMQTKKTAFSQKNFKLALVSNPVNNPVYNRP
jgi:CheY-like chemotaxis protein